MGAYPQHLGQGEDRPRLGAGDGKRALCAHLMTHLVGLLDRTCVKPGNDGENRLTVPPHGHHRLAHAGDADSLQFVQRVLGGHLRNHFHHALPHLAGVVVRQAVLPLHGTRRAFGAAYWHTLLGKHHRFPVGGANIQCKKSHFSATFTGTANAHSYNFIGSKTCFAALLFVLFLIILSIISPVFIPTW